MKIAVLTDSSAELSQEQALEKNIYVVRMPLIIDGKEYIEEEGISRTDLMKAMRGGTSVTTSQPKVGTLIETFTDLLKTHDHVIFIPISSLLSGTYQTALTIAEDFSGRITVVDCKYVSAPIQIVIQQIKDMIAAGMEPTAIRKRVEKEAFMYAALIPQDIVYLKRGGRITPAAAAMANLLKIVPILKVTEGSIDLADKVRTHRRALSRGVELAIADRNINDYEWTIVDGDSDPEALEYLKEEATKQLGFTPEVKLLNPIVLAHTGPGTVAIACTKKIRV